MEPQKTTLLDQTKQTLKRIGIPIVQEKSVLGEWSLSTGVIHFDNGPAEILDVSYKPNPGYILISDRLAYPVSKDKVGDMLEIINELNTSQAGGTYYFDGEAAAMSVSDGFYVNDPHLDEVTFEKTLQVVMKKGENFFPMIRDFLSGKNGKGEILGNIDRIKKEALKNEKEKE